MQMNETSPLSREETANAGPPPAGRRIGVLLVNLGTPDGTDYVSMWRYLREFLSDQRVIELPRALWYPILYGIVLTTRPQKSGANYEKIWNREKRRVAAAHLSPARRPRSWPQRFADHARSRRRLGDALRPAVDRAARCDRLTSRAATAS